MNFFVAVVGRIMAPTNQPHIQSLHSMINIYSTSMTPRKCSMLNFYLRLSIYVCVLSIVAVTLLSLSFPFSHSLSILVFVVCVLIWCLPFVQIKIIFMTLTIRFRIYRKIVKSIGMAILWMVTALRAILGDGSCSVLSSLFSSLDI